MPKSKTKNPPFFYREITNQEQKMTFNKTTDKNYEALKHFTFVFTFTGHDEWAKHRLVPKLTMQKRDNKVLSHEAEAEAVAKDARAERIVTIDISWNVQKPPIVF